MNEQTHERHILLSNMGTNVPRVTKYQFCEETHDNPFSAVALWKLLPIEQRPTEIRFLLTPEAEAIAKDRIIQEAAEAGVPVEFIEILGNETPNDSQAFLERVADQIPQGCRLTLDVTQGLRHHAFLFCALAFYLGEFRGIDIVGAWYCRWEISSDAGVPRPFIDLKPVLDLARWFHALAVLRETGSTAPMANLIQPFVKRLRSQATTNGNDVETHKRASELQTYVDALKKHAFAYSAGLPLEFGKASSRLTTCITSFPRSEVGRTLPLANSLAEMIALSASETSLRQAISSSGKWKEQVELNLDELQRQSHMIDTYLSRGQISLAAGLMREWVISWLMWKSGSTGRWLDYSTRKPFEQQLGGLSAIGNSKPQNLNIRLTEEQVDFVDFWNKLSGALRNALLHHGMRADSMEEEPRILKDVHEYWTRLKAGDVTLVDNAGGHGRLLICPIGLTPGVLYSALSHTKPERCIVICSELSSVAIVKAFHNADSKAELLLLKMKDVNKGIDEFDPLITQAAAWLFGADEIRANLTGGTTLMGVLVSRLVAQARDYQRNVNEFVLIDPRTPEEQRSDPWHVGDIHYLDGNPDEYESDSTD